MDKDSMTTDKLINDFITIMRNFDRLQLLVRAMADSANICDAEEGSAS